uniref:Uncharacterized protein n=1 Tax=Anguilla anguilla TaxID=7936 RepID=A0A0E9UZT1_ANGAN
MDWQTVQGVFLPNAWWDRHQHLP